jgi:small-conductance mechanosensitive channel
MLSTLEVRTGPSELESVEIHVAYYNEVADEVRRIVKTVDLSAYDGDQEFYQAKYHYTSNGQVTEGYWLYDPETGAHTELNNVFTLEYTNPGTYFPVALFRSDDSEMTADSQMGTEAFKTTEKMLKYLNMDYKDIGDSLHENDDIKDIDQAVLMLGVPITGTNELEMEYLFEFFDNHLAKMPAGSAPAYSTGVSRLNTTPDTSYAIDISDADFRITLSFDSITKKLGLGEGKIGDHGNVVEEVANDIVGVDMSFVAPTNARLIRRWVTETMYEEIRVVNPKLRYHIYKSKGAESSLDDERLLIPLDYEVVRKINLLHREELYFRSMHFVFNSHVVQKTKWYQSGIFQAVMIVVAVVITVMTYGQGWQSLAAALAAGGAAAAAAAWTILQGILWYVFKAMVFQFVLQELVEIIGIEVAFYLAIAAAMYGGLKLYQNDMVLNATAQNLLGGAMGLTSAAQTELKSMFEDYQSDVEEFNLMQEGKFEELEEVNRELDSGIDLNPFTFIGKEPMLLFGEDPDEYYARTIHSGNVGLESMNIVQNFVGISLRLPTMQETTGDTFT